MICLDVAALVAAGYALRKSVRRWPSRLAPTLLFFWPSKLGRGPSMAGQKDQEVLLWAYPAATSAATPSQIAKEEMQAGMRAEDARANAVAARPHLYERAMHRSPDLMLSGSGGVRMLPQGGALRRPRSQDGERGREGSSDFPRMENRARPDGGNVRTPPEPRGQPQRRKMCGE